MLEINLCLEKARVAAACRRCAKLYGDAFYLYAAESRGEELASALFEVGANEVSVVLYTGAPDDHFLFDGVLRAGLAYADGQGIENGVIPEAFRYEHRAMFDRLNYPVATVFNIVNFFAKYKNCARL